MTSCESGAECNKMPEIFLLPKHPNISSEDQDESRRDQEKLDLVELLEAVTYLVCQDNHVVPDTFYKVEIQYLIKLEIKLNFHLRFGPVEAW